MTITDDVAVALDEITGFYRNYHSLRFVEGDLVLRMQRLPAPDAIEQLNADFADILASGQIEPTTASKAEIADDDVPDLARLRHALRPPLLLAPARADRPAQRRRRSDRASVQRCTHAHEVGAARARRTPASGSARRRRRRAGRATGRCVPLVEEPLVVVPDRAASSRARSTSACSRMFVERRGRDQLGPQLLGHVDAEPRREPAHLALEVGRAGRRSAASRRSGSLAHVPERLRGGAACRRRLMRVGRRRVVVDPLPEPVDLGLGAHAAALRRACP